MTEQPFDRILRQAAMWLTQHYPGEQSRIGRGLEIALNQPMHMVGSSYEGSYTRIHSATDPEIVYTVMGTECDCPDQSAPGQRCKHRFASAILRLALALHDLRDNGA